MIELVDYVVKQLVNDKESVSVTLTEQEDGTNVISISVSASDIGKVIGKQGKIASAIRSVVKAASQKTGKKHTVEIVDSAE